MSTEKTRYRCKKCQKVKIYHFFNEHNQFNDGVCQVCEGITMGRNAQGLPVDPSVRKCLKCQTMQIIPKNKHLCKNCVRLNKLHSQGSMF